MRRLVVPGTKLQSSRFIFGTSSLFTVGSRPARRRLLEAAVDNGFLHFDTAPYYGFGVAERDLAAVLKAHPHVGVTTKVGLYSPGGDDQPASSALIRKVSGKVLPAVVQPTKSFDLDRARRSLEGSLRRLGRDCIDLYMLHEPELHQVAVGDWVQWLEASQRRGQIRYFGLALTADRLAPFLSPPSPLVDVVQVLDSLRGSEANILKQHGRPLQITYGYVSAARAAGEARPVEEILRRAMERNPHGPIIVSTRRLDRVGQYSQLQELARD